MGEDYPKIRKWQIQSGEFVSEAGGGFGVLHVQSLERDLAPVALVADEEDVAHAPAAQGTQDFVAVGEDFGTGHGDPP